MIALRFFATRVRLARMADQNLLCLRCRGTGHIINDCRADDWWSEHAWMFSNSRMQMDFESAWSSSTPENPICQRCQQLGLIDILNSYPQWTSQDQLADAFENGHELIRSLGKAGTIKFREDCQVCRCLFALTPNPASPDQEYCYFRIGRSVEFPGKREST
jgi:hypothetical protein